MQLDKKQKKDGFKTVHNVHNSQRNNYVSFFYLHLAKNLQLHIFLAV